MNSLSDVPWLRCRAQLIKRRAVIKEDFRKTTWFKVTLWYNNNNKKHVIHYDIIIKKNVYSWTISWNIRVDLRQRGISLPHISLSEKDLRLVLTWNTVRASLRLSSILLSERRKLETVRIFSSKRIASAWHFLAARATACSPFLFPLYPDWLKTLICLFNNSEEETRA